MTKEAYISIEGVHAKIFIPKGKNIERGIFYQIETNELLTFLKENKIKQVTVSQFIPDFITLTIPIPFASRILKNKKLLNGITITEIRKKYPAIQNFSYFYKPYESAGRTYLRCYIVFEEQFNIFSNLVINGINVKAFYPSFIPIVEIVRDYQNSLDINQIICYFSKNLRFLFILKKDEVIFQRFYESEPDKMTDEDVVNINMTVNYALQNLRINPEKIFFIGIKAKEIEGLNISYEFLNFSPFEEYILPISLQNIKDNLKGKEFSPSEYTNFKKIKRYFQIAVSVLLLIGLILIFNNFAMIKEVQINKKHLNVLRNEILAKEKEIFTLQDSIKYFEENIKPFLELQNKKNSLNDIRASIYPVSEAGKIKESQISSIEVENTKPQKIKITGKISGNSFTEREVAYTKFKDILINKGFIITKENWSFIKGEFNLEGNYEFTALSQK